ncbi:hypothetical protein TeGR_g15296, partial [Tetraparma gracilis]
YGRGPLHSGHVANQLTSEADDGHVEVRFIDPSTTLAGDVTIEFEAKITADATSGPHTGALLHVGRFKLLSRDFDADSVWHHFSLYIGAAGVYSLSLDGEVVTPETERNYRDQGVQGALGNDWDGGYSTPDVTPTGVLLLASPVVGSADTCYACKPGDGTPAGSAACVEGLWAATQAAVYNKIAAEGDAKMPAGATLLIAEGTYAAGLSSSHSTLFHVVELHGSISCDEDGSGLDLHCVLDGSGSRRVMLIEGTSGEVLELRGLLFFAGNTEGVGGGLAVNGASIVELVLCTFQNSHAGFGGGVGVEGADTSLDLSGVVFQDNLASCTWSIFIDMAGTGPYHLNLAEVQALDSEGNLIAPSGTSGYDAMSTPFPASNCIDGDMISICHSTGTGPEHYLRVDYSTDINALASITVENRHSGNGSPSCGHCQNRIVGAKVHVAPGQPSSYTEARASALWTGDFSSSSPRYTFSPTAVSSPCQTTRPGADIYRTHGSVSVLDTCPGESSISLRGEPLDTWGTMVGSLYSYTCYYSCDAGHTNPTSGYLSSVCEPCPTGSYSGAGSRSCEECPGGSKLVEDATDDESVACSVCASGKFSTSGSTTCSACLAGSYATAGSTACTVCEDGKYSGSTSSSCTSCPAGKLLESAATADEATACGDCATGKYSGPAAVSCTSCSPGKHLADAATPEEATACSTCASGAYSGSAAATCTACDSGKYLAGYFLADEGTDPLLHSSPAQCLVCGSGKYIEDDAADAQSHAECTSCAAGTYIEDDGTLFSAHDSPDDCAVCAAGSHSGEASATCSACSAGKYLSDYATDRTLHDSEDDCLVCGRGKFSHPGTQYCSICPAGSYAESEESGSCTICPTGKFNANLATSSLHHDSADDCEACPFIDFAYQDEGRQASSPDGKLCGECDLGYGPSEDGIECEPCEYGEYSETVSFDMCKSCPEGAISTDDREGCLAGVPCPIGFGSSPDGLGDCLECAVGRYSSVNEARLCDKCQPGKYLNAIGGLNEGACKLCPAGTSNSERALGEECEPCRAGYYTPNSGFEVCGLCAVGEVAPDAGMTSCTTCQPGYFSNSDRTECERCQDGFYTEHARSGFCLRCPNNYVSNANATGCVVNEGFFIANVGAENDLSTVADDVVLKVPRGVRKDVRGMNVTTLALEKGYWRAIDTTAQIRECLHEDHCLGTSESSEHCSEGYTGPLCGVCEFGYAATGTGFNLECNACEGSSTATIAVGMTMMAIVAGIAGWWCYKARHELPTTKQFNEQADGMESRFERLMDFVDAVAPVGKILLSYWQIASGLSYVFEIPLPRISKKMMAYTISPLIVSACIYKYYTSLKVNPAIPVGASSLRQLVGSTPFGDFSKSFQKKLELEEKMELISTLEQAGGSEASVVRLLKEKEQAQRAQLEAARQAAANAEEEARLATSEMQLVKGEMLKVKDDAEIAASAAAHAKSETEIALSRLETAQQAADYAKQDLELAKQELEREKVDAKQVKTELGKHQIRELQENEPQYNFEDEDSDGSE